MSMLYENMSYVLHRSGFGILSFMHHRPLALPCLAGTIFVYSACMPLPSRRAAAPPADIVLAQPPSSSSPLPALVLSARNAIF